MALVEVEVSVNGHPLRIQVEESEAKNLVGFDQVPEVTGSDDADVEALIAAAVSEREAELEAAHAAQLTELEGTVQARIDAAVAEALAAGSGPAESTGTDDGSAQSPADPAKPTGGSSKAPSKAPAKK